MSDDIQKNQEMDNDNSKSSSEKVLDKCVRLFFLRNKWVFRGVVLILVIILFVLIKIGFTPTNNLPAKNIAPTQKPVDLCAKFPKVQGEISCEEAVKIALANTPGIVQHISIGPVRTIDPSTSPPKRVVKNMWLVDVKLANPYFGQNFKKEVRYMRIGIGLDENDVIYKEVIGV